MSREFNKAWKRFARTEEIVEQPAGWTPERAYTPVTKIPLKTQGCYWTC